MNIDSVEKALKQIQSIKRGEENYTIHKANWCGYCIKLMEQLKTLLQQFNKAGKKINIQITTVDEEHADMYNKMRTKNGLSPVESVSSFPTIISEKSTGSPNQTNATTVSQDELIQTVNSAATPVSSAPGSPMSMAPGSPVANVPSGDPEAGLMDVPVNELEPGLLSASPSPIAPPSVNADILDAPSSNPTVPPQMGGYGLYPAIASTAYHLAPAGILLATAAATFKCRKGRKGKKRVTRRRK
jgi:thiol-disulfide isomerase/thioredoxin